MDFDIASIPSMSMAISQSGSLEKVGTAVLSKSLDVANENAAALTRMMELSVNPNVGASFDVSV